MRIIQLILFCLLIVLSKLTIAQTLIKGVITDGETQEFLPFVTVQLKSGEGTMSDINGLFQLKPKNIQNVDTLIFSYFGYKTIKEVVYKGKEQTINIVMNNDNIMLNEVVIEIPENPAHEVIRRAVAHKKQNDIRLLDYYQYETYSRIELQMNNLTEKFKKNKALKKLNQQIEELQRKANDSSETSLPVFISETISDFYFRTSPESKKEVIKATKITGVGVEDGSVVSQFLGPSFQQFNFYENSISILNKEFISPLTSAWKINYRYILDDTVYVNGHECYEFELIPKREQDLAFRGTIWITTDSLAALKKVDLVINKDANLNFIEKIHVIQEWNPTNETPWYVSNTDITIDIEPITKSAPAMRIKSSASNKDIILNKSQVTDFYEYQTEILEDSQTHGTDFWNENRHDSLNAEEKVSLALVDSLRNLPAVRSYVDIVYFIVDGHQKVGKKQRIAIGPYIKTYAYNKIEKHRFRLGFKTNENFSPNIALKGYLAYGTGDKRWKYNAQALYVLNKRPWTEIGFQTRKDIDLLGLDGGNGAGALFSTFMRWGTLIGAYTHHSNKFYIKKQVTRHLSQKITLQNRYIKPLFDFAYYTKNNEQRSSINTSEIILQTHYGKNEVFVQNGPIRKSFGGQKGPAIDVKYTLGVNGVLGSGFNYHKLDLMLSQKIGLGSLGRTQYWFNTGKVFSTLPYPLLNVHLGNESLFYTNIAFSLMNYFEFVSDQYVSFVHEHHFDGFIFNRIPLMRKLKWRTVTNINVLYGSVSKENVDLIPNNVTKFTTFESQPYVEVGYGIENIFRVFRIQAFHRLTYLDNPRAKSFGIRIAFQFAL